MKMSQRNVASYLIKLIIHNMTIGGQEVQQTFDKKKISADVKHFVFNCLNFF